MKQGAAYVVPESRPVRPGAAIRSDEVISLFEHARQQKDLFFRRIVFWDEKQQRELVFLTNHRGFAASTIAASPLSIRHPRPAPALRGGRSVH